LEVLVVPNDGIAGGRMAVNLLGAHDESARADENGHAVFEEVRPGAYRLEVCDPDFVWSSLDVDLRSGESRSIVVHEPPGWTARVALVDSVGRPVPFARVHVDPHAPVDYVRVEDGVQDMALYTDRNGEISLPRMHRRPATVTFLYGSRFARVELHQEEPFALAKLPPP
jgi:hypothetical protein